MADASLDHGRRQDILLIAFPDIDPFNLPSHKILDDLGPGLPRMVVHVERSWASADMGQLRTQLSERAGAFSRCIVVGIGAGGRAALLFGRILGAELMLVWAPSGGIAAEGFAEAAAAAYGSRELDRLGQAIHLCTAVDTHAADLALLKLCRPEEGGIRLDRCDLPYPLLHAALRETGRMVAAIQGAMMGAPADRRNDLSSAWQAAFQHDIELDLPASGIDAAGAFHLRGRLRNRSSRPFDVEALDAEHVFVGARIVPPGGDPLQPHGARYRLMGGLLPPAAALPFRLRIEPELVREGTSIMVALVCERSFWFDHYGFPASALELSDGLVTGQRSAA